MCSVPAFLAAGSFVVNAAGQVAGQSAQARAAEENEAAARRAFREANTDISLLEREVGQAGAASIFDLERQGRAAEALAAVSAGEAGVSGASVKEVIGDIKAGTAEAVFRKDREVEAQLLQLHRERISGRTVMQNRIAAVRPPSGLGLAIGLLGTGLRAGQQLGTALESGREPASDTDTGSGN